MTAIQRTDPVGYTAALIDALDQAWEDVAEQQAIIAEQQAIIAEASTKLEAAKDRAGKAFRELHEELMRMDVAQNGNFGWEQRAARFLVALRKTP